MAKGFTRSRSLSLGKKGGVFMCFALLPDQDWSTLRAPLNKEGVLGILCVRICLHVIRVCVLLKEA
jgi:hypothetical protein